jgi:NADH-quinone oxidoreductase subunit N
MDLSTAYDSLIGDLFAAEALVLVALFGLVLVVVDAFRNDHPSLPWLGLLAVVAGLVMEVQKIGDPTGTAFYGMIRTGGYAAWLNTVILLSAGLTILLSPAYLGRMKHNYGEVYAIILFASLGMMTLASANSLVSVFVGLETMSVCLYIITGLVRDDEGAIESALKYFLLGAFATGFFLYGIALLYGATGTLYLPEIAAHLALNGTSTLFWAGVALLMVGFLFKVSAVPFHMWTPDVYQGAPTTLTGFMATASKAAAFGSLILVLYLALPAERWTTVLAVIAVITMVYGNIVALVQSNVKRMLAYSSIAHAGYILVALAAGTTAGYAGALFYLLVYAVMNIGAFGVMALLEWDGLGGREQTLDSLAGVGHRRPILGWTMVFFMFSLAGFPPLGGFLGKYAVFAPAVDAGLTWLVIVGVLASAASAYYYLRVLVVFFMKTADEVGVPVSGSAFPLPRGSAAVLIACAAALVILGVAPQLLDVTASLFASPGSFTALP